MTPLIMQGLNLAMLGMGTVFIFLTMLVGATTLMSRLLRSDEPAPASVTPSTSADPHLLAAISAAVSAYRRRQ